MSRFWAVASSIAAGCAAVVALSAEQQPGPDPAFRSRIDVVQMDVSVLDGHGQPLRGLTARDFSVREDGVMRPIVAFSAIEVPEFESNGAGWLREVREDVATNDLAARRLIVLVLDDASGRTEPVVAARSKAIAHGIIDALGPADLAAVVFTAGDTTENFTDDRARLRRAVDTFAVQPPAGLPTLCPGRRCVAATLGRVSAALAAVPERRKTVFYVSTSGAGGADSAMLDGVLRRAQWSNVTVHAIDPTGLLDMSRVGASPDPGAALRALQARHDALRALAERTGGRAIVNSNDPAASVRAVLGEGRAYYVLGVEVDRTAAARSRRLDVTVARRGVEVRTRRGYYLDAPTAVPAIGDAAADLRAALLAPLPSSAVALGVSAVPLAGPDLTASSVIVVGSVRQRVESATVQEPVRTVTSAFGATGRAEAWRQQAFTFELPVDADGVARYGVLSRLELPPGSYEIRLALARSEGGPAGSVYTTVDVPDFAREPLSMSGLLLEAAPAPVIAPLSVVEGLVPIVPTALRDFTNATRAHVLARVHQGHTTERRDVRLTGRVVDATGRAVFDQTTPLSAALFDAGSAEGVFELPLASLAPGPYVLIVSATAGDREVQRSLRFTVR